MKVTHPRCGCIIRTPMPGIERILNEINNIKNELNMKVTVNYGKEETVRPCELKDGQIAVLVGDWPASNFGAVVQRRGRRMIRLGGVKADTWPNLEILDAGLRAYPIPDGADLEMQPNGTLRYLGEIPEMRRIIPVSKMQDGEIAVTVGWLGCGKDDMVLERKNGVLKQIGGGYQHGDPGRIHDRHKVRLLRPGDTITIEV